MKAFKIKKKKAKQPVFVKEIISIENLPRPKMPLKVLFTPVKYQGWAEMVWEEEKPILRYHQC